LEPSCLLTLRDEIPDLVPGTDAEAVAERAVSLEELLDRTWSERPLPLRAVEGSALVHGHCHQKALGGSAETLSVLARIPGLDVEEITSGCCGMAGAFGYHAEHRDVSMAMGELDLLPAVRDAGAATRIVADGTSCRAQINDGAQRKAVHAAVLLAEALEG
jgi:Fe-S oxidoreductase